MNILMTLCYIEKDGRLLLGKRIKPGFGEGLWNGFGGKLKTGESFDITLCREVKEECGLDLLRFEKRCILIKHFPDKTLEVHTYRSFDFHGEPKPSNEMIPRWFDKKELPIDDMHVGDGYWLDNFLDGEKFIFESYVDDKGRLARYEFGEFTQ